MGDTQVRLLQDMRCEGNPLYDPSFLAAVQKDDGGAPAPKAKAKAKGKAKGKSKSRAKQGATAVAGEAAGDPAGTREEAAAGEEGSISPLDSGDEGKDEGES